MGFSFGKYQAQLVSKNIKNRLGSAGRCAVNAGMDRSGASLSSRSVPQPLLGRNFTTSFLSLCQVLASAVESTYTLLLFQFPTILNLNDEKQTLTTGSCLEHGITKPSIRFSGCTKIKIKITKKPRLL